MKGLFLTVVLVTACTKATPDPGVTKEPVATASPPASPPAAAAPAPADTMPRAEIDQDFVGDVKTAFAEYRAWGRVDDELRWAPWLCRMPNPAYPHMSAADDGGHARKLYSLFAKDHTAYVSLGRDPKAKPKDLAGQIIAKESFIPELVTDEQATGQSPLDYERGDGGVLGAIHADHFNRYARVGDKTYRASTLAGVYFMIRKDVKTPKTDQGWVYATVTPPGEITSAGRVASCMGCHATAKFERLFGRAATTY